MSTTTTKWKAILIAVLGVLMFAGVSSGQKPLGAGGGPPAGKGGGGGHTVTAGNNLSTPVIFADEPVVLRGTAGVEKFTGASVTDESGTWFEQQDALNEWQAGSFLVPENDAIVVDEIDWGDNLEAKDWRYGAKVRVETVLYNFLPATTAKSLSTGGLSAYTMKFLYGEGISEMWGTNTLAISGPEATVFSEQARLIIQKLTRPREDAVVTWDDVNNKWIGDIGNPLFTSAVYENEGDGPGGYSAEVNVPGKVIYGYNWDTRKVGDGAGDYRITFRLDPYEPEVPAKAQFDELTVIRVPVETEDSVSVAAEPVAGGTPLIVPDFNLTYIDVRLTGTSGGGKKKK